VTEGEGLSTSRVEQHEIKRTLLDGLDDIDSLLGCVQLRLEIVAVATNVFRTPIHAAPPLVPGNGDWWAHIGIRPSKHQAHARMMDKRVSFRWGVLNR
jgi:hypothetical protein